MIGQVWPSTRDEIVGSSFLCSERVLPCMNYKCGSFINSLFSLTDNEYRAGE